MAAISNTPIWAAVLPCGPVVVAPPLALEPKTWWFPIVGSASYRGYFSEAGARRYAANWDKKGWDTYVGDVTTYSTLGWFHDPLLSTFIFESDADLADTIFHELTHQRLYIAGDTDFNEAFATMVAEEGVRRWFQSTAKPRDYELYEQDVRRENDFVKLVMATRDDLQKVYGDASLPEAAKLQRKTEIIAQMRANYTKLKKAGASPITVTTVGSPSRSTTPNSTRWPPITIWCRPSRPFCAPSAAIWNPFTGPSKTWRNCLCRSGTKPSART